MILITLTYAAAIAMAAESLPAVSSSRLAIFGLLVVGSLATVEMTRRSGENAGIVKDLYAVWELPIAILLPPLFALIAPIARIILTQWRIRQIDSYRRVFSAAVIGLSYGVVSAIFHEVPGDARLTSGRSGDAAWWLAAAAAAAAAQWAVNQALLLPAIKGTDPAARVRDLMLNRESLQNDLIEMSAAVLATAAIAVTALAVVLVLPLVTVLQRSSRHAQLVNESRIDSKTGLLNAGTWHGEANGELSRARRTGTPLTVALIDLDEFKAVNDSYGHLAGDRALWMIADSLRLMLRDYDLAGRFGGDEIAVLLPQTGEREARRILERIRAHIAGTPMLTDPEQADGPTFGCTISVGATTFRGGAATLTELLASADAGLYRAKQSGRNQVRLLASVESQAAQSKSPQRERATVTRLGQDCPAPNHEHYVSGLTKYLP
ncbi:MAG: sensor domain-containing diguanylate cyclase [Streptosporangiaceae bacterium]